MKKQTKLQQLPYGSVISYRTKLWFKSQGLDGDILSAAKNFGHWVFIEGSCPEGRGVNWKTFKVLYNPEAPAFSWAH